MSPKGLIILKAKADSHLPVKVVSAESTPLDNGNFKEPFSFNQTISEAFQASSANTINTFQNPTRLGSVLGLNSIILQKSIISYAIICQLFSAFPSLDTPKTMPLGVQKGK